MRFRGQKFATIGIFPRVFFYVGSSSFVLKQWKLMELDGNRTVVAGATLEKTMSPELEGNFRSSAISENHMKSIVH